MEIVVKGRHLALDVGESFRQHCTAKLSRLERLDGRLRRLDVELSHEPNPRQSGQCERVEITIRSRGPVVRAEAAAADCYAAFERAFAKVEERMRRAADRRTASHSHSHHAHLQATAPVANSPAEAATTVPAARGEDGSRVAGDVGERDLGGGLVVREKLHQAEPMRIDEALHRMELVGHDFYLYSDAETGHASVVYRRRGYDYGVLRLAAAGPDGAQTPDGVGVTPH